MYWTTILTTSHFEAMTLGGFMYIQIVCSLVILGMVRDN